MLSIIMEEKAQVAVIMVPFPAQGHLNQLLQLSCLISSYGIRVHYVGSATHNRQAKFRINGLNPLDIAKIHFHDLPIPAFVSPPPNPNSSIKFPAHLLPSWIASLNLRQPIAEYLREISSSMRKIIVIHDTLMAPVVQDVATVSNAESYVFNCISTFTESSRVWERIGKPFPIRLQKELPSMEGCTTDEVKEFAALRFNHLGIRAGDVYNTSRVIEGTYVDLLAREEIVGSRKVWAVGPILPFKLYSNSLHQCLEWLDKQGPKSVIYISFGTTVSMSDEEIKELALGLEQSKQNFLWVLRDADKGDVFDGEVRRAELPEGFVERTRGVGMVVRDWAPEPEILAHPSTGGFMSHCGWNSCIESITMGVPIAAWPMHSDQPRNAMFTTDILKIGILVREWTKQGELVKASMIENVVRRLMASDEGIEIRKKAEEVAAAVRMSTEAGGVSRNELDSFISHITR
ncbi:zeatin O-glucosyltransferase-like [Olea europaea subsp. europaea]|uniref:Zeatin O-glucosyltransferase-like n=1 Tax=Olea europaea subsp. europaea TaxID=158383 RepID=A0A8S0U6C3_OLEEU|nr:zeatin O-glucosyltransferase-like [Olea europaea subsp. europaea]